MFSRLIQCIGILLMINPGLALGTDADQSFLTVNAESAVVDKNKGSILYSGKVAISHGTMHIAADMVEIITRDDSVVQIIADTNPDSDTLAHLEMQPENKELVYADASEINYFIEEERMLLSGKATLRQADNEYIGELIHYNVNQGIVNLKSGPEPDDRIKIRYNTGKADTSQNNTNR